MARRRIVIVAAAALIGVCVAWTASYFWPHTVQFNYAGSTCFANPVLLPGLTSPQHDPNVKVELIPDISIGSFPLFAGRTCVTATAAPLANSQQVVTLAPFGNGLFKKRVTITIGDAPKAQAKIIADRPLPTKDPLVFNLDKADAVYHYKLGANNKMVDCKRLDTTISCDLAGLGLAQSTPYEFTLVRLFNDQETDKIFTKTMATVEALAITHSSIAPGQKVFSVPTNIVLDLNKPATTAEHISLTAVAADGKRQDLPTTHAIQNGSVVVAFSQPLPRSTNIELRISDIRSADGAYLPGPFVLAFSMSGGPQVAGINIGSAKTSPSAKIALTFDSTLGPNQPYGQFVQLLTPAGQVPATATANGNTVTLAPHAPLPPCTPMVVKVADGIQSAAGITGGSAWQYNSRTLCQTAFSIGASVKGRAIMAYRFGGGPSRIVLVGGIHGNEKSSTYTLQSLIDYLESNPTQIPANRTITIIPIANPDGYAANTRLNANNVDLNRNFAANNWKSSVTVPGGTYPQGGGASPMDQPESKALGNFTVSQNPRLVLSYHAVGPLVAANEAGDSLSLASAYGKLARIPNYGNNGSSAFNYDTTGAFDDWLAQKHGIASMLIELSTNTGNEFNRHRAAMMAMLQLP